MIVWDLIDDEVKQNSSWYCAWIILWMDMIYMDICALF